MLVSSVCLGTTEPRIVGQVLPCNSTKVILGSHCVVDSIELLTRDMFFCIRVQLIA